MQGIPSQDSCGNMVLPNELEHFATDCLKSSTVPTLPGVISLNVGGYKFVTTLSTLTKDSNSMLAAMFSGRHHLNTDSEGRYFIDRDGSYFEHILNFLRDSSHLPSAKIALEVYKEAKFYQIEGLVETLERFSIVFSRKLEDARKLSLGSEFEKWQQAIITHAQEKSLQSLVSTSKVSLLSLEDHKKILECDDCVGQHDHNLVVTKPGKQGLVHHQETFEYVQRRFKDTSLVICSLDNTQMKLFVSITEADLKNSQYQCTFHDERIRCKNVRLIYGLGKQECKFCVTEYVVEFEW